MNAVVDAPIDQAAVRKALFEELGLTVVITFVPFSQSRSAKPKPNFHDLQVNWRVTILRNHEFVLSTDYSTGIGHVPGYTQGLRDSLYNFNAMWNSVEEGVGFAPERPFRNKKIPPPTIDDVLYSLVLDSDAVDHANFESWASDFGYETDSRAAEAIYKTCLDIGLKLRAAVGSKDLAKLQEVFQDY